MKTYVEFFATRDEAYAQMLEKKYDPHVREPRAGWRTFLLYCLVDGPEDNFAVVDLETAIDLGVGYEWRT